MNASPRKQPAPVDPDVKLPAAIRAASERANEAHKQFYSVGGQEADTSNKTPASEAEEGNAEVQNPKDNKAPAAPDDTGTEPPKKDGVGEDWQHKYNSVKGRFDRQEETVKGLNKRIAQMEQLLARQDETPKEQRPASETRFAPISEEDREAYGDEFLDVVSRAAAEKFLPQIEALQEQVRELGGKVTSTANVTKEQTRKNMFQYLDSEQANWRELNYDPNFIAWANLPDAFSGATRISMMRDAFEKGDAQRVLRFFKGFLADEAVTEPATDKPEMPNGKVPLEQFAAPGRAKAPAATPPPGQKETITRTQIAAFYRDVNRGKYRGRDEEKNRLETMIFEAEAEGRVL